MCVMTLPIIQDEASSSAPKQFADVEPDNSIPEINVGVNTRNMVIQARSQNLTSALLIFWGASIADFFHFLDTV